VTGFHVPNGDSDALCAKLTLLMADARLRAQMGAQAADYARNYDWEKIATQIIQVYTSLLTVRKAVQG
jgi:glycosyltransferase involved in cell wall biosynthesis